jgi:hypothetical protein
VTKSFEVFSGCQLHQMYVLNQHFKDHLGGGSRRRRHHHHHHHQGSDGPRNIGSVQTPNAADSPRRLHQSSNSEEIQTNSKPLGYFHLTLADLCSHFSSLSPDSIDNLMLYLC